MKNKIEETEIFLHQEQIDVLCISETWIQPQEINHIRFPGYNISSCFCRNSFLHGGTMILTKNTLNVIEISQFVDLSIDKAFECSAVEIKFNECVYCIICLYRTPDSDLNIYKCNLENILNFSLYFAYYYMW